mmetsp:Transcript_4962/g.11929  ORF Transcript_4962/g.11929 Transcript_4962/m.11929 type:complete len:155 (-) Transcript_4962:232-696(-)
MGRQSANVNRKKVNHHANHRRIARQKKAAAKYKSPFVKKLSKKKQKQKLHRLAMEKNEIESMLKEQGIDVESLMIEETSSNAKEESKRTPVEEGKNSQEGKNNMDSQDESERRKTEKKLRKKSERRTRSRARKKKFTPGAKGSSGTGKTGMETE